MKEILCLKRKWLLTLLPISILIILICKALPFVAEYIFARGIYRVLAIVLGTITRWFPFSVGEICIYVLPFVALFFFGRFIFKLIKAKGKRMVTFGKGILNFFCVISIGIFAFVMLCGTNYYRYRFETYLDYTLDEYTKTDLYNLCDYLVEKLNESRENVQTDKDGITKSSYEDTGELLDVAGEVMSDFSKNYAALRYSTGEVKPVLASRAMSYTETVGIYIPFTMEANINIDTIYYNQPVDAIHELAHLRGIMLEDEANYIAYLACISSNEPDFIYSGYMLAYIYASNQLYDEDIELYSHIIDKLSDGVKIDLTANHIYWKQFDTPTGNKIANVSNKLNDTYLNINGQEQGTKSYGMVVDLLIAEYKEKVDENNK
ncbi:MAG: DUF3810 domain-containing protein [Lachnospiraceae bacterium]|nr:DUF3810 domain-containing protein [Lachnospiraceae bacterium]